MIGSANFGYDQNRVLSHVSFEATGDAINFQMPGTLEAPLSFDRVAIRGNYLLSSGEIALDHIGINGGPFSADASGKLALAEGHTPAMALDAKMNALSSKDLLRFWPLTIGKGARNWIAENILAGTVGPFVLKTQIPAGAFEQPQLPDDALSLNFPISGAEANYLHGLTHLTMVNGSATLSGDTFTADLLSGQVGPLGVKKGHVVIPNLHIPGTAANISAHVDGAVTDILALIDQKPLGYPTKFGIDPADTKGSASVDLSVIVPTEKDLSVDQVRVAVKADSTKFEIALGSRGRLTGGAVGFVVDNDHLFASGTGLVGGSPLALNWNEDFRSGGGITTRISAKGTLDDAARDALRLNTGSYLKGPILLDATLTGRHGHFEHADATIDLSPTNLAVDLVGIDKPSGTPAGARVLF